MNRLLFCQNASCARPCDGGRKRVSWFWPRRFSDTPGTCKAGSNPARALDGSSKPNPLVDVVRDSEKKGCETLSLL
jgi:hypothetical protein